MSGKNPPQVCCFHSSRICWNEGGRINRSGAGFGTVPLGKRCASCREHSCPSCLGAEPCVTSAAFCAQCHHHTAGIPNSTIAVTVPVPETLHLRVPSEFTEPQSSTAVLLITNTTQAPPLSQLLRHHTRGPWNFPAEMDRVTLEMGIKNRD